MLCAHFRLDCISIRSEVDLLAYKISHPRATYEHESDKLGKLGYTNEFMIHGGSLRSLVVIFSPLGLIQLSMKNNNNISRSPPEVIHMDKRNEKGYYSLVTFSPAHCITMAFQHFSRQGRAAKFGLILTVLKLCSCNNKIPPFSVN